MAKVATDYKISHPNKLYIGGDWTDAASGAALQVFSPSTEECIATVAEAGPADIDRAVAAARRAFDQGPWPSMSIAERGAVLRKFAAALEKRATELAICSSDEGGGALKFTEMTASIATPMLEAAVATALATPMEEVRQSYAGPAVVVREPVGVVAAILPWNAPVPLSLMKLSPALIAGCTVILKTAPETPLYGHIFADCAAAAGFPPGVLSIVAAGREASDRLVRHPGVDKVSFTGSVVTGKHIAAVCSERLARFSLELGGKSAAIVMEDADIGTTVPTLASYATTHAGQICYALTRILVPNTLHDKYADALVEHFNTVRIGDPLDRDTDIGPLASAQQLARVKGYVAKGQAEGAVLATGGSRPKALNRGHYFEPTLFTHVDNKMTIAQEEIFGPVLCLIGYDGVDDAIAKANDSRYGLHGAVFTNDAQAAYKIGRQVRTGSFGQNGTPVDVTTVPFGGFKESGMGREGGIEGINGFVEYKTVYLAEKPAHLN